MARRTVSLKFCAIFILLFLLLTFGVLLFLMTVGSRLSFRILDDLVRKRAKRGRIINVLIYGAGRAGKLLFDEYSHNPDYSSYQIMGFIDDQQGGQDLTVAGLPVYSREEFLGRRQDYSGSVHEVWVSSVKIGSTLVASLTASMEQAAQHKIEIRKFKITIEE